MDPLHTIERFGAAPALSERNCPSVCAIGSVKVESIDRQTGTIAVKSWSTVVPLKIDDIALIVVAIPAIEKAREQDPSLWGDGAASQFPAGDARRKDPEVTAVNGSARLAGERCGRNGERDSHGDVAQGGALLRWESVRRPGATTATLRGKAVRGESGGAIAQVPAASAACQRIERFRVTGRQR